MILHFIRPEWLWAYVALPLFLAYLWRVHRGTSGWDSYIASHLSRLLISPTSAAKKTSLWWLTTIMVIAILALSGPAVTKKATPVFAASDGRVIVLDMSNSLYANDLVPNRLTQEKFRATDLINALTTGDTGLVVYAADAFTISPITNDKHTLLNLLPTLSPAIMPSQGSNLAAGLTLAQQLLTQGGYLNGDIIVLTDGINAKQFKQAQQSLDASPYRLAIIAIGTDAGAAIHYPDGTLQKNIDGDVVIAKTNMSLLAKLAAANGGLFVTPTNDGSDVNQVIHWLKTSQEAQLTDLHGEQWQDLGPYIALLLLLPVVMTFRHGLLASLALMTVISVPQPAQANTWQDLWHTQDQQAQTAYQQGQYQQAAQQFTLPQWQAAALYQAKQYEQALAGFSQDKSANGLYNQGNALMQLGKFADAKQKYQQSLALQPEFAQAQSNLELAEKLLQEQQNTQDQQSSQGQQDVQDQQSSQDQQDGQDQQGSQGQQDGQDQQGSQGQQDGQDQQGSQGQQDGQNQQGSQGQQDGQNQQGSQGQQDGQDPQGSQGQQDDQDPQGSQGQQDGQDPAINEAQMQADANAKPSVEETAPATAASQSAAETQALTTDNNQQPPPTDPDATAMTASNTSPTTSEQMTPLPMEMQRMLNTVNDDPQVLLRNKMLLEYQKRQLQGTVNKETEQW
ncbi:VWA domain-containing protein [Shewanella sp. NIFS-20-20]|uniref:VWA domain-containing protein n=1 Tax=Shewanella sp. NIFS-20-20 TaxID=2853806 RepID=UPI001C47FD29|nr:VWA domain-containing protein [Shewanella sp. NIFS-20-20]MBV7315003.1 VWA domain-containing protein [Shewanella sp. NIFS-20-20]